MWCFCANGLKALGQADRPATFHFASSLEQLLFRHFSPGLSRSPFPPWVNCRYGEKHIHYWLCLQNERLPRLEASSSKVTDTLRSGGYRCSLFLPRTEVTDFI